MLAVWTIRLRVEFFDEVEGATYKQLEEINPNAHYVNIASRSRGYGKQFYMDAFMKGGQGGYDLQDVKNSYACGTTAFPQLMKWRKSIFDFIDPR